MAQIFFTVYKKIARENVEISLKNSLKTVLKIYDRYRNSKLKI